MPAGPGRRPRSRSMPPCRQATHEQRKLRRGEHGGGEAPSALLFPESGFGKSSLPPFSYGCNEALCLLRYGRIFGAEARVNKSSPSSFLAAIVAACTALPSAISGAQDY